MRDIIFSSLNMEDVLNKYGIEVKRNGMFSCPFHEDKRPSAKMYKDSFYCFSCNKAGDLIRFVEDYFNLSFKEAMQKINIDFNLGIDSNTKIDYTKINKIKRERNKKKREYEKLESKFEEYCDIRKALIKIINILHDNINTKNWEKTEIEIADIQQTVDILDLQIDELMDKLYDLHSIKK